jgi:GNAT superfamily N-acetyltransferase
MTRPAPLILRPAHAGDGAAVFEITRRAIVGLATAHYRAAQLANWLGTRTPAYYETAIAQGGMVVAERDGALLGFVDTQPGTITRLYVLPAAAGAGLGGKLLDAGLKIARTAHTGPIRVEATLNAEPFYRKHGFIALQHGFFTPDPGSTPVEIVHMERPAESNIWLS